MEYEKVQYLVALLAEFAAFICCPLSYAASMKPSVLSNHAIDDIVADVVERK